MAFNVALGLSSAYFGNKMVKAIRVPKTILGTIFSVVKLAPIAVGAGICWCGV